MGPGTHSIMGPGLGRHTCQLSKLLNEGWVRGGGVRREGGVGAHPPARSFELGLNLVGAHHPEKAGVIEVGLNHDKEICRAALSGPFPWLGPRSEFSAHDPG